MQECHLNALYGMGRKNGNISMMFCLLHTNVLNNAIVKLFKFNDGDKK